jgi:hypothetical protein
MTKKAAPTSADDGGGKRSLYDALAEEGLLEYGAFIPAEAVRQRIGLVMPEIGTKREFDRLSMLEMAAVDGVREILLNYGKYICQSGDGYRILTPGENSGQVDRYLAHAQNKIRRARKLERTSPAMTSGKPSQMAARILLSEQSKRGTRKGTS